MSDERTQQLKQAVYEANLRLAGSGLVLATFGNVSGIDREAGLMAIKPSGVAYEKMTAEDMVLVSLETGKAVDAKLNPSSDTPTHWELYRAFADIGGVVHTHSQAATAWAQAGRYVPCMGTTHADYFHGPIPCTRRLTPQEINTAYEANTGKVIVQTFRDTGGLDPAHFPGVLVACHGPFTWGNSPDKAVEHAIVMEYLAKLALDTLAAEPYPVPMEQALIDKHFLRKHGPSAYYGQGKNK